MTEKIRQKIADIFHYIFEIGIFLKGVSGFIEIIAGVLAFLAIKVLFIDMALEFTQENIDPNANDGVMNFFFEMSQTMSIDTQNFIAFYLLSHGIVKVILVIGLFRRQLWAYPTSIAVFVLFIVYQMYKYFQSYSVWMLVLTALDIFLIWLTVHEYKYLKKRGLLAKPRK